MAIGIDPVGESKGVSKKSAQVQARYIGRRHVSLVEETDALLVGGGDCQYLCHWMQQSGLAERLPSLLQRTVYVGLSAGSMIMTRYGTTYGGHILSAETDKSLGLLDFALHPHLDHEQFPDNSMANLEKLAGTLAVPSYAIDDQTAIKVVDGRLEVVSEGHWKLFTPCRPAPNSRV